LRRNYESGSLAGMCFLAYGRRDGGGGVRVSVRRCHTCRSSASGCVVLVVLMSAYGAELERWVHMVLVLTIIDVVVIALRCKSFRSALRVMVAAPLEYEEYRVQNKFGKQLTSSHDCEGKHDTMVSVRTAVLHITNVA